MQREINFTVVLRSGERYDHSIYIDENITDKEEIKKICMQEIYNDKIWIELNENTEKEIDAFMKKNKDKECR